MKRMKSITLTFLVILFGCCCSSGNELINRYGESRTQFGELNDDVLYIIASYLGLRDLVSFVQVDSRYSEIAHSEVNCRYRHHSVLDIYQDKNKTFEIYEKPDKVTIFDVQTALNVLKFFGKHFQTIMLGHKYNTRMNDLDKIIEHISKYSSKSLHLYTFLDLVKNVTAPIEAVEVLSMETMSIFKETIRLNEIFPRLRQLALKSTNDGNYSFINSEFPHLEHFSLFILGPEDHTNDENVRELIRKNPTIRNIGGVMHDQDVLKFINQHLPNIENLTISTLLSEPLQFDNLKHLKFASDFYEPIGMDELTMPRLETLTFSYYNEHYLQWMAALKNLTHLRRLNIEKWSGEALPVDLDVFTADLPNLTEATFYIPLKDDDVDSIIRFIKNHTKLVRCRFMQNKFTEEKQKILRERLGDDWNFDFVNNEFTTKASGFVGKRNANDLFLERITYPFKYYLTGYDSGNY